MTDTRRFIEIYRLPPAACSALWRRMGPVLEAGMKPKNWFWGLEFLRVYDTEAVSADAEVCTESAFQKWSWDMVSYLSKLTLVRQSHNIW